MFADNVGVNTAWIDVEVFAQEMAETRGVENRPRAYDTVGGQARPPQREVGEDVHRIGCDEDDSVRTVLRDLRNDLAEDCCVAIDEIKGVFPGMWRRARRNNGYGRGGAVAIVAGPNARRIGEWLGMIQVHGLAFSLGVIYVDEYNFC